MYVLDISLKFNCKFLQFDYYQNVWPTVHIKRNYISHFANPAMLVIDYFKSDRQIDNCMIII